MRLVGILRSEVGPTEAEAVLIVDAYRVLGTSICAQRLEAIAGWRSEVVELRCGIEHEELAFEEGPEIREPATRSALVDSDSDSDSESDSESESESDSDSVSVTSRAWGRVWLAVPLRERTRASVCASRAKRHSTLSRFFRWGEGMQAKPPHATFQVLEYALEAIQILAPVVARIQRFDRDLADQLRRALSSIALNAAEGNRSQGGHRVARFSTAAGSTSESRAALRVAVAWGYVAARDIETGEARLDRVAAMLHGLGARR
jgi:four helix bundle protein